MTKYSLKEIDNIEDLERLLHSKEDDIIVHCVFNTLDFFQIYDKIKDFKFSDCMFLGCEIPKEVKDNIDQTCVTFPKMNVPYRIYTSELYNPYTLYEGYDIEDYDTLATSYDKRAYQRYISMGKYGRDIYETLARSIHDHAITDAMYDLIDRYDPKMVVAVMGGHAILRTAPIYRRIVYLGKLLTEKGRLIVTGGGPGAMEAAHLGAWMAGRSNWEVEDAISMVVTAPSYRDRNWLKTAFEVLEKYPQTQFRSLGVPTWFYGHEPACIFSTDIAKYFANSIREDGIITIAHGGIIYTPGSAGTMQEIFQDAAQNHYLTDDESAPMIFFDTDYWTNRIPVYKFLQDCMEIKSYANLRLSLSDDIEEVYAILEEYVKMLESK